jgi:hypothetical protein
MYSAPLEIGFAFAASPIAGPFSIWVPEVAAIPQFYGGVRIAVG